MDTETSGTVDETNDGAEQQVQVNPRDLKMQEMRERIRLEREADNAAAGTAPAAAAAAEGEGEAQVIAADPPPATTVTPPATAAGEQPAGFEIFVKDGKQHVRMNVYGQTEEVPLETALRRGQKDVAAERKLQEAIERERRAAAAEQLANQRLAQLTATSADPVQPVDATPDLKAALEQVYEGNLDAAAAKLQQLMGRPSATPINPEVIAAQVEQRLQHRAAADRQAQYDSDLLNAVTVFQDEFPDLAGDERLSGYFDKETELVMQKNPKMPLNDVVRTAAATIRKMVTPASSTVPTAQTRIEAKRNAPSMVHGVRAPTISTKPDAPVNPKTARDVIAEMRKMRGQAGT